MHLNVPKWLAMYSAVNPRHQNASKQRAADRQVESITCLTSVWSESGTIYRSTITNMISIDVTEVVTVFSPTSTITTIVPMSSEIQSTDDTFTTSTILSIAPDFSSETQPGALSTKLLSSISDSIRTIPDDATIATSIEISDAVSENSQTTAGYSITYANSDGVSLVSSGSPVITTASDSSSSSTEESLISAESSSSKLASSLTTLTAISTSEIDSSPSATEDITTTISEEAPSISSIAQTIIYTTNNAGSVSTSTFEVDVSTGLTTTTNTMTGSPDISVPVPEESQYIPNASSTTAHFSYQSSTEGLSAESSPIPSATATTFAPTSTMDAPLQITSAITIIPIATAQPFVPGTDAVLVTQATYTVVSDSLGQASTATEMVVTFIPAGPAQSSSTIEIIGNASVVTGAPPSEVTAAVVAWTECSEPTCSPTPTEMTYSCYVEDGTTFAATTVMQTYSCTYGEVCRGIPVETALTCDCGSSSCTTTLPLGPILPIIIPLGTTIPPIIIPQETVSFVTLGPGSDIPEPQPSRPPTDTDPEINPWIITIPTLQPPTISFPLPLFRLPPLPTPPQIPSPPVPSPPIPPPTSPEKSEESTQTDDSTISSSSAAATVSESSEPSTESSSSTAVCSIPSFSVPTDWASTLSAWIAQYPFTLPQSATAQTSASQSAASNTMILPNTTLLTSTSSLITTLQSATKSRSPSIASTQTSALCDAACTSSDLSASSAFEASLSAGLSAGHSSLTKSLGSVLASQSASISSEQHAEKISTCQHYVIPTPWQPADIPKDLRFPRSSPPYAPGDDKDPICIVNPGKIDSKTFDWDPHWYYQPFSTYKHWDHDHPFDTLVDTFCNFLVNEKITITSDGDIQGVCQGYDRGVCANLKDNDLCVAWEHSAPILDQNGTVVIAATYYRSANKKECPVGTKDKKTDFAKLGAEECKKKLNRIVDWCSIPIKKRHMFAEEYPTLGGTIWWNCVQFTMVGVNPLYVPDFEWK